ncbi:Ti-type conjugative transfer relaxase TraA [Allorhizobium ampelinum]|uniref:Ti-type conjugative transfer relaxase TraA n=1 Tax=Allorhizobium ampelinum TaxID=3025782 RepID=UPI000B404995|nr:Ti-type conjugative transfer relaxase TraA [Allorhizobium ampelinum]MCF1485574.1 Ti-type conjugative transfer relaxase TraA [Allorhizobium ampelinum]NTA25360.1 Ti-type conjugative transfer relaxase TraA [Allorhizobium ampelinum]OVE97151.1 Ti-type conjugative transfer relaxase TraA [Allorhizobium ampelinum]
MAIYHCSMKPISRSSGRSAVAAAAYRTATMMLNERDGVVHDFTHKHGVQHAEIVLPDGVNADWAYDRSALWNAAERMEKRKDARVAREFEIGLPHELSSEQRLSLTRDFAFDLANRYGTAVDFAIHAPHESGDVRNFHAHVMMTTRRVGETGLSEKTFIERENKWLLGQGLATTDMQLRDIRQSWESIVNEHLAREGLDIRIDHRSHAERGLEIAPTEHVGVHATQMQRQGMDVDRARLDDEALQRNAALIREKPEQVLSIITNEKSVFDRYDIARTLHRYIDDDAQAFQNALASVMASVALVELQAERVDPETGEVLKARYSTREMIDIERAMADGAQRLADARSHGVDRHHVDQAIEKQDVAIRRSAGDVSARLSDEQRRAILHITGSERVSAVVGFAGAGKSTMLAAAREAWERQGYRVHGAALSGKAAEGLEESSGIQSRTLASWSHGWERDRGTLGSNDVFVIDEAGMVGSRQLAQFIAEAEQRGAKVVLVGDHEQLQAIGAGAPFRAIVEKIGYAELSDIRRQREDWQRQASVSFATHKTTEGLAAYRDRGNIHFTAGRDEARAEIVRDYLADRENRPDGTRVAMAHRRADVRVINDAIRSALQNNGQLGRGEESGEILFQTNDGKRSFAPGDRIVFLENSRELGVKNGMLGTVQHVEAERPGGGPRIIAQLDGRGGASVSIPMESYQAIDHGYATTIHKNQGATVDRAFVLASATMDRHLTYVAMTRHRDEAHLYAAQEDFADRRAGKLVAHGTAPFEHKVGNRNSYFVTLENAKGERSTTWGVDLERAMKEAAPEIGAMISIRHDGSEHVLLPNGQAVERNIWTVRHAAELAYQQLESRLSRSGAKETTLDYDRDLAQRQFAERRGIAEVLGVSSEIDLAGSENLGQELQAPQKRRRSMFDGLKLKLPSASSLDTVPEKSPKQDRLLELARPLSAFEQAVDRYARAYRSADRHLQENLPVLETQKQELFAAAQQLDQSRPGAHDLIRSALQYDPKMSEAMTELSGRARLAQLVAGMDRERSALNDPNVRADRFIERWQELKAERQQLRGFSQNEARGKVDALMRGMAQNLERDPQLENVLRNRAQELGIRRIQKDQNIAREMERQVTNSPGLGLGLGLER